MIGTLGDDPSGAATETLEALATMPAAQPWAPAITDAAERQARKRREHEYRHSGIGEVVETLDNRTPANAGDLAALVVAELEHLSGRIRDGSTSDWRRYWNVDRHNRPVNPKPEESCRDAVLSDLRGRLERLGIDAQPEGVYADDTCAGWTPEMPETVRMTIEQSLDEREERLIPVCVVDVSEPLGAAGDRSPSAVRVSQPATDPT